MTTLLTIIHVLVCIFLVAIVLLQHGKGADAGATFGGGSSQTLFGSEGPVPLLNKITTFSAIIFMGTSVMLAYISTTKSGGSIMSSLPKKETAAQEKKEQAPLTIPMPAAEQKPQAPAPPAEKPAASTAAEPARAVPEQAAPAAGQNAAAPAESKQQ